MYKWWVNLKNRYFKSPWTLLAFITAILLVVGDIVQAVFAVLSYYKPDKDKPKMP